MTLDICLNDLPISSALDLFTKLKQFCQTLACLGQAAKCHIAFGRTGNLRSKLTPTV
jgi:hypothetical protein